MHPMIRHAAAVFALGLALPALAFPAHAEVTASSDAGFAVGGTIEIAGDVPAVWAALVEPARWWSPDHSWSGDAANFSLDPRAGGCFCEALPGGGSVEHMHVIYADPGEMLRMRGALGPLQSEALTGTLSLGLAEEGAGTTLVWIYVVGGFARFDDGEVPAAVDEVLAQQFGRLAALFPARD